MLVWVFVLACGAVLAARERFAFSVFVASLSAVGLFVIAMVLLVAPWTSTLVALTALGTLGLLGGAAYAFAYQRGRDAVPDVLREHFDPALVFETDGVEVAWTGPQKVRSDEVAFLDVWLQNCVDRRHDAAVPGEALREPGVLAARVGRTHQRGARRGETRGTSSPSACTACEQGACSNDRRPAERKVGSTHGAPWLGRRARTAREHGLFVGFERLR